MAGDPGSERGVGSVPESVQDWLQSLAGEDLEGIEAFDGTLTRRLDDLEDTVEDLETDLDRLDQQLNGIEATLEGRINGLDSSVDALRTKLGSLERTIEDLEDDAGAAGEDVERIEERVESVDAALTEVIDDLEAAEAEAATAHEGVADARDRISALEERTDGLAAQLDAIGELDERVDSAIERLNELDTAVDERVEDLETELVGRIDRVESTANAAENRAASLEEQLDDQVEDVRERVIQVKREVDGKAPADHDHPDLEARLGELRAELEELATRVGEHEETTEEALAGHDGRLGELEDGLGDLSRKMNTLAAATVSLRDQVGTLTEAHSQQAALTELLRTAHREGVTEADCENCEETVELGLLNEPSCPHCEEPYSDLTVDSGLFRRRVTLNTGPPPALEGDVADEGELTDLVDEA